MLCKHIGPRRHVIRCVDSATAVTARSRVVSATMAREAAIRLAPGAWRIPTVGRSAVNSFAFVDDDGRVTLIDCGLKKAPARIVAGLAAIGKRPSDVTRIVLTHV